VAGIANNIAQVQERITRAAWRTGRSPGEITLVAVTKTFPTEVIADAYAAGLRIFGENRVQEFAGKAPRLAKLGVSAEWHMIGHLQSNKAAKAAELFHAVDSLDSVALAEKLNSAAEKLDRTLDALIEVNIGGEEQKSGVSPDSAELEQLLTAAPRLSNLRVRGLMTVPPWSEDAEASRPYFRQLRELRDQIAARRLPGLAMDVLSMGMSNDFEVAIAEGSTCVRVGTAIFGKRPKPIAEASNQ